MKNEILVWYQIFDFWIFDKEENSQGVLYYFT